MSGSGTMNTLNEKLTGQRNLIERKWVEIFTGLRNLNNVRKYQLKMS